jgi:hypothetical protein
MLTQRSLERVLNSACRAHPSRLVVHVEPRQAPIRCSLWDLVVSRHRGSRSFEQHKPTPPVFACRRDSVSSSGRGEALSAAVSLSILIAICTELCRPYFGSRACAHGKDSLWRSHTPGLQAKTGTRSRNPSLCLCDRHRNRSHLQRGICLLYRPRRCPDPRLSSKWPSTEYRHQFHSSISSRRPERLFSTTPIALCRWSSSPVVQRRSLKHYIPISYRYLVQKHTEAFDGAKSYR